MAAEQSCTSCISSSWCRTRCVQVVWFGERCYSVYRRGWFAVCGVYGGCCAGVTACSRWQRRQTRSRGVLLLRRRLLGIPWANEMDRNSGRRQSCKMNDARIAIRVWDCANSVCKFNQIELHNGIEMGALGIRVIGWIWLLRQSIELHWQCGMFRR